MSPDTGLTIDIVETIDYQDFFEVAIIIMIINLLLQLTNIIDLHGDHHGEKGASRRAFLSPRTKLGVRWQARSFSPLPNNAHLT